jgi:hypothetical protein
LRRGDRCAMLLMMMMMMSAVVFSTGLLLE